VVIALVMEALCTSKTLVKIYLTTWQYIPEDSKLHTHCCENLKFHISNFICGLHKIDVWYKHFYIIFKLNLYKIGKIYFEKFTWLLMTTHIVDVALTDDRHGHQEDMTGG
jgi:hypothetical protein